jgi:hypothetical protein
MPSSRPNLGRHRLFAARVVLPFEQVPIFPAECLGCGKAKPPLIWKPEPARSPFSGKAAFYLNQGILPEIQVPVCEICIDHMPGHDQGVGTLVASILAPAMLLLATLLFVAIKMEAAAVLTGLMCLTWFLVASRAVWVLKQSTLFDVQTGKDDHLVYYFRDPEYAAKFNELNRERPS